nr:beta-lactamase domain-containing protein 2-like [Tanacetum cinerariifolium]
MSDGQLPRNQHKLYLTAPKKDKLVNIEYSNMSDEVVSNAKWVYDNPINSDVDAKLRSFLVELRNDEKILGIQVAAYKDGKVIIDTAAGVLGKDDRRPVQPSSLFPLFSVTKGVTAGMVHWLADKGKLKLDENVANFWPEFGTNGKEQVK